MQECFCGEVLKMKKFRIFTVSKAPNPDWPVMIKIYNGPHGFSGRFVSSTVMWQHFNLNKDKLGQSFTVYGLENMKNTIGSKKKKLTFDFFGITLEQLVWWCFELGSQVSLFVVVSTHI